jgi:putative FmdB family regulatory protein
MPIYEYQCQQCDHKMEALQKVSDDLLVDCPSCEKPELKKNVTAAGFRLKGSGWYETDFKTGSKKNLEGSSGEPKSPSKSDSSGGEASSKSSDKPKAAADS